jgi:glycosyltransferase involved in cell wall biosynthesis
MRLTIVLPKMTRLPSGGLKVQYEAAGALAARGHLVTVVHPMSEFRMIGVRGTARYAQLLARQRRLGHGVIGWYALCPSVRLLLLPFLAGYLLPAADVTLLTAWQTAEWARKPRKAAGKMAQVVYDYEFWMSGDEKFKARVANALSRPEVCLFSPSDAVTRMLREIGREPRAKTPPGIDLHALGCDIPPELRPPKVGFALRPYEQKAMPVMAEACRLVLAARPGVAIACYGEGHQPFPSAVQRAGVVDERGLRQFYNSCQIFVVPSHYEGFGLPAAEAMACGAAVVTTANGGSEEVAIDGQNSLVVPPGDPQALAAAIIRLLDDPGLRVRVARAGAEGAMAWSLDAAASQLERALGDLLEEGRPSTARGTAVNGWRKQVV